MWLIVLRCVVFFLLCFDMLTHSEQVSPPSPGPVSEVCMPSHAADLSGGACALTSQSGDCGKDLMASD